MRRRLLEKSRLLQQHAAALSALSPLAVLARGYSVTQRLDDGTVIQRSDQVSPGDQLRTQTASGTILSRVTATQPPESP